MFLLWGVNRPRRGKLPREDTTMNYETALRLKEAGFSQDGLRRIGPTGTIIDWQCNIEDGLPRIPTLSKLIVHCGGKLDYIKNNIHEWKALGINGEFGRGTTPEEAVANLWLSLEKEDFDPAEQMD